MTPNIPNTELDDIASAQDRRARRMEYALIWSIILLGSSYFWSALAVWWFS